MNEQTLNLHELQRPKNRASPVESLSSQTKSDSEFVRWISSHRDSVKNIYSVLDTGNSEQVAAIPEFLEAQNTLVLSFIDEYESKRRDSLDHMTSSFDKVMSKVERLYECTSERVTQMRRKHRQLTAIADNLNQDGRVKEAQAQKLLSTLKSIEDTRTKLLRRIQNPQWEVSHHFHMTALEHFRGNTQPHLMDIAIALPGQLRVCAMAKQTNLSNTEVFTTFQRVKQGRDDLLIRLDEVNKHREILKNKLSDASRILEIMKSKMGPETEMHLERLKGMKKSNRSRTKGYMQIKMRYFQKLKVGGRHPSLAFEEDEQKDLDAIIRRNSEKDRKGKNNVVESSNFSNGEHDGENGVSIPSEHDVPPLPSEHDLQLPSELNGVSLPSENGVSLPTECRCKSESFGPCVCHNDVREGKHDKEENGSKNLFGDLGVKKEDWEDLGQIVENIKELNLSRERALGRLEFALDCREHLRNELSALHKAYLRKVDPDNFNDSALNSPESTSSSLPQPQPPSSNLNLDQSVGSPTSVSSGRSLTQQCVDDHQKQRDESQHHKSDTSSPKNNQSPQSSSSISTVTRLLNGFTLDSNHNSDEDGGGSDVLSSSSMKSNDSLEKPNPSSGNGGKPHSQRTQEDLNYLPVPASDTATGNV